MAQRARRIIVRDKASREVVYRGPDRRKADQDRRKPAGTYAVEFAKPRQRVRSPHATDRALIEEAWKAASADVPTISLSPNEQSIFAALRTKAIVENMELSDSERRWLRKACSQHNIKI